MATVVSLYGGTSFKPSRKCNKRESEQSSVRQHLCACHTCHTALALAQAGHVIYQAQLKAFGLVRCQGWTADNSGGDILNSFNYSCQLSVYECVLGIVLHHKGATHTHSTWRDNSWHADNEACLVNPPGLSECFYYLTFALSNNAYTAPRALSPCCGFSSGCQPCTRWQGTLPSQGLFILCACFDCSLC